MIASTIRLADPTRPVFTGMHGATNSLNSNWNMVDQGELYDALTTHPYPAFTEHCGKSALNTIPAIYHATAETLYYAGGSGKGAFIEEIGSFGPGYIADERTEKYAYNVLILPGHTDYAPFSGGAASPLTVVRNSIRTAGLPWNGNSVHWIPVVIPAVQLVR
jgi:hypothetical protein